MHFLFCISFYIICTYIIFFLHNFIHTALVLTLLFIHREYQLVFKSQTISSLNACHTRSLQALRALVQKRSHFFFFFFVLNVVFLLHMHFMLEYTNTQLSVAFLYSLISFYFLIIIFSSFTIESLFYAIIKTNRYSEIREIANSKFFCNIYIYITKKSRSYFVLS